VREQRIETVLKVSPELIDPKFAGCKVETQLVRGKSRLDLLIHTRRGATIVEIKKVRLSYRDVEQLLGYCRSWCLHHKLTIRRDAYLVGLPPKNETALVLEPGTSKFRVNLLFLGQHLPMLVQEKSGGGYERWAVGSKKEAIRLFE
jgi:hypothetical protein